MKQFGFLSVILTTGQVILDIPELIGTDEFSHFSVTWHTHARIYTHAQIYLGQSCAPRCS